MASRDRLSLEIKPGASSLENKRTDADLTNAATKDKLQSAKATGENVIAFTATVSKARHNIPLQIGDTVIYDTLVTNEGESYNKSTGQFTCPITGTYFFTANTLTGPTPPSLELSLMVNGREKMKTLARGQGDSHGQSSNSVVLHCDEGDCVWMQLCYCDKTPIVLSDQAQSSSFSGFLIG